MFRGHGTGVYTDWTICKEHVICFIGCSFKCYEREEEVDDAYKALIESTLDCNSLKLKSMVNNKKKLGFKLTNAKYIVIVM